MSDSRDRYPYIDDLVLGVGDVAMGHTARGLVRTVRGVHKLVEAVQRHQAEHPSDPFGLDDDDERLDLGDVAGRYDVSDLDLEPEPPTTGSTCLGCQAKVSRDTQRCPKCGGTAFLDPVD